MHSAAWHEDGSGLNNKHLKRCWDKSFVCAMITGKRLPCGHWPAGKHWRTNWISFGAVRPYGIESKAEVVRVKFIRTDPLPIVQVRVNNSAPVNFFIDTGGAEVILDTDFAQEIGVTRFGIERGVFGGGKTAGFEHGRVDSLMLGDVAVVAHTRDRDECAPFLRASL